MPLSTTTLDQVEDAIRTAIRGITPRLQPGRDTDRWVPYERASASAAKTRMFRLDWELAAWTPGGLFGLGASDTGCTLHVVTDYTIPEQRMAEVVEDDHWQLRDVLSDLGGTAGIIQIESAGAPSVLDEENKDHFQADHAFRVRYLKARV